MWGDWHLFSSPLEIGDSPLFFSGNDVTDEMKIQLSLYCIIGIFVFILDMFGQPESFISYGSYAKYAESHRGQKDSQEEYDEKLFLPSESDPKIFDHRE
jgi:hypothetical protein